MIAPIPEYHCDFFLVKMVCCCPCCYGMVRLKVASAILLMFIGANQFYWIGPMLEADLQSVLTEDNKTGSISTCVFFMVLEPTALQQRIAHVPVPQLAVLPPEGLCCTATSKASPVIWGMKR